MDHEKNQPFGLSLKTQVYSLIFILVSCSFAGRLFIDIENTRTYFSEKMSTHALDTATSLGLSISPYTDSENLVVAETMISAIFDSGYFSSIKFVNNKDETLIERQHNISIEGVPEWFIKLFPLPKTSEHTEVNGGWFIVGTLIVESHPGVSYRKLWEHTVSSTINSAILLFVSLLVAFLILQAIFKPLKLVEAQAENIKNKKFTLNKSIPFTTELRNVTGAMNHLVTYLNSTFQSLSEQSEELSKQVYMDELTQIGNRRALDNHFSAIQKNLEASSSATAVMISLDSLQELNNSFGYTSGDSYIIEVKNLVLSCFDDISEKELFRINGGSFLLITPIELSYLATIIKQLDEQFAQRRGSKSNIEYATVKAAPFAKGQSISQVLSLIDTATATFVDTEAPSISFSEWRTILNNVLAHPNIKYTKQPVLNADNEVLYFELFTKVIHDNNPLNNTQLFMMAERLNLTTKLDKAIIRSLINKDFHDFDTPIAINLSKQTLFGENFVEWTQKNIIENDNPLPPIIFEIKETAIMDCREQAHEIISKLKSLGFKVCIEHFALNLTSIKYIQGLNIDYVKLDGSFTADLRNNENHFFLKTLITICHSLGIKFITCLIESDEDFLLLSKYKCDYFQGNFLTPPTPLNVPNLDREHPSYTLNTLVKE